MFKVDYGTCIEFTDIGGNPHRGVVWEIDEADGVYYVDTIEREMWCYITDVTGTTVPTPEEQALHEARL